MNKYKVARVIKTDRFLREECKIFLWQHVDVIKPVKYTKKVPIRYLVRNRKNGLLVYMKCTEIELL